MRRITILILFLCPILLSGQDQDTVRYKSLDPYYFHLTYLKTDPSLILDVREKFEFRGKRIKGAINVPSRRELDALTDTLNINYSLFLYCTTGYRSRNAAEYLYDKGLRNLYNLEGGLVAWKKDDMPVIRGKVKK